MTSRRDKVVYDLEIRISHFLRYGVVLSLVLLVIGWIGSSLNSSKSFATYTIYQEINLLAYLKNLYGVRDYSSLVLYAGLMVLVLLPLIRVLLTGLLFVRQKEKIMSIVSFFVLAVLVASFLLGVDL
ncbi:MAG: DUF1634 domain-containing protein [Pseudobdellovibrio sp.]